MSWAVYRSTLRAFPISVTTLPQFGLLNSSNTLEKATSKELRSAKPFRINDQRPSKPTSKLDVQL